MRKLVQFGVHLVLVTGWLFFISGVTLYVLEHSGGLRWILEREIARRLGPLGGDLSIERAELRWFTTMIDLEGVTLGRGGDVLRLNHVRVTLPSPWTRGRSRIEARDGHLVLSPAFLNGLRGLTYDVGGLSVPGAVHTGVPTIQVEDLHVDLLTESWGELPLGRIDVVLREDDSGFALTGRLIPTLAARAEGPGEIYLEGHAVSDGLYEVRAHAIDLPLSTEWMPSNPELARIAPFAPKGVLSLDARARVSADETVPLEASARISLTEASLSIPGTEQRLEQLRLEGEAHFDSGAGVDLLDPAAWSGLFDTRGLWLDAPWRAELLCGREHTGPDELARGSLHARDLPLGDALTDILRAWPALGRTRDWLDTSGTAELCLGVRVPVGEAVPLAERPLELAGALTIDGSASVSYRGPVSVRGIRDVGFPYPAEHASGSVVVAFAPARLRPMLIGLVDLRASSGEARLSGSGVLASMPVDLPPYKPGHGRADMDLLFEGTDVAVDAKLEAAFTGLAGLLPRARLWDQYNPVGGKVSGSVHLRRTSDMRHNAGRVEVELDEVGLTWSPLPVSMQAMSGRVEFKDDGSHGHGVSFAGRGTLRTTKTLSVAGRFQSASPEADAGGVSIVEVDVERLSLTGDDVRVLGEVVEGVAASIERFGARGFADTTYKRVRALPGAELLSTIEIGAGDPVRLTPAPFPMATGDVRGRVLIGVTEPYATEADGEGADARYEARVTPIVGTWGKDVQVAFLAEQRAGEEARTEIYGAGIDPASKSLLGSLSSAVRGSGAFSTGAFTVDGRLDFNGVLRSADEGEVDGSYRFHLRGNQLVGTEHFRLDGLRGKLELRDGNLFGRRLSATLGTTPVELRDASFTKTDAGFRFRTRLAAEGVPLDREHLQAFIGEETLTPLLEDLELRGRIDIEDALLTIEGPPAGARSIEFEGLLRPRDAFMRLGLPISVDTALVRLERLSFQHGKMRAWAMIEDLEGRIADRNLGPADMLVTYVQPRLSIENVDARFEGGRVRPLGSGTGLGGSAFSIDLAPPFPFQLGMSVRDVELAGLLRGLFASNIATRGTLSCDVRLTGDTEHLLDLSGAGSFELRGSRLWSIPVFRALFSRLGLDDTAVFDDMHTNVRLRDGVIQTNDIEVHSPLLQLVGSGSVDLDGGLRQDLEVRYSIVDYLGPLRRLFYTIQNGLVSVAIRGDLSRPRVLLRSPFVGFFLKPDDSYRALPLPDLGPLPERF